MPKRNPTWTRDELILAFDFYVRRENIPNKNSEAIGELSRQINALARLIGLTGSETLRNRDGVYMKLMNFRSRDPDFIARGRAGLTKGNQGERWVWDHFGHNHKLLCETATSIRSHIVGNAPLPDGGDEDSDEASAAEGRLLTRIHRSRERNRKLVLKKREKFKEENGGNLFCEACGFNFYQTYGGRGVDVIDCHHTKPVHTLRKGDRTRLSDLVLLCANCHRIVHAKSPWLDLQQLRDLLKTHNQRDVLVV